MEFVNYIAYIVLMLCFGLMYSRFKSRIELDDETIEQQIIQEYLLTGDPYSNTPMGNIAGKNLPIMWIHTSREPNSRQWTGFHSRSSTSPNQPYLELTIKSIVDKCAGSFKVCLIDDYSFEKLLPNWTTKLSRIPNPIKANVRKLAFAKLLSKYGGLFVPASFACTANLRETYDRMSAEHEMFVTEIQAYTTAGAGDTHEFSDVFMGGTKNAELLTEYETYIATLISVDTSANPDFSGTLNRWSASQISMGRMGYIPGQFIGTRDGNGAAVAIERLMSEQFVELHPTNHGLYIPENELLKRTAYNWFCVLSHEEILESNLFAAKMIGMALSGIE